MRLTVFAEAVVPALPFGVASAPKKMRDPVENPTVLTDRTSRMSKAPVTMMGVAATEE